MNGLTQSLRETMLTKQNKEVPLIYHVITGTIHPV